MKRAGFVTVLLVFASACATSAPDRAAKAASSLEVMQQNSSRARAQIGTVLQSLDALLNAPADRLRESYDRYDKDVKKMNEYADAIRENNTDLRNNGNAYLSQWQRDTKNVADPELRAIAERRRNEIAQSSQDMRSTLTNAVSSFEAFLRDINDIHKVIGNDLTPTGQANVRLTTVAQTARSGGANAEDAILQAERAIENLRTQITPAN